MTDLALLEDSANHALCRERVFKDCADLFSESTDWLHSQNCFLCHDCCKDIHSWDLEREELSPYIVHWGCF